MTPDFLSYVAIDWSGAKGRRHKGIAIAEARGDAPPRLVAVATLEVAHHEPALAEPGQRDVAVALKVRPATVPAWETGISEPAALDASRLARLFKVDIAVILPPRKDDEQ